jgi:alpha-tubulin suppressor-like RCC1 family protein
MPFSSLGECLKDVFVTEYEIIDRYVGNQLWSWGSNFYGALGINLASGCRSSPVQTVSAGTDWKQVSGTFGVAAAIKTDGSLWLWGNGSGGRLGTNSVLCRSSPVQTISAGTNWRQVSVGGCVIAAVKTDGTLWSWGVNGLGALGDNSIVSRSSPVQTFSGGTNWKQVSISNEVGAGIKTDGTLWLWGQNSAAGSLGNNSIVNTSSPVQTISAGTNWKQVSVAFFTVGAIKTDGTLWVWGDNASGRLGIGSSGVVIPDVSSPIQTVSGGTNWKQVSMGTNFSAAIKKDGTLWTWGTGTGGRLGNNATTYRSSPVQTVSGGTNWKQVSNNGNHVAAIKTDGTLWMWGYGSYGQHGNNTILNRSSPVQVITCGTNWKQVAAALQRTMAVTFTQS